MPRAEEIVRKIREWLPHDTGESSSVAAELAQEYLATAKEVNRRLDHCVSLLRQGMRSEAIHLAETPPPVIEEAAALDFSQRAQWIAYCEKHDLATLPHINTEAAIEIDEAFPQEKKVERLLRTHRRLALGRAPLRARIKVLRRLIRRDAGSPLWSEDLVTFEKARHTEIGDEAQEAWSSRDLATLEDLEVECGEIWLEQPPSVLHPTIKKLVAKVRDEQARAGLAELNVGIAEAHERRDFARAEHLLQDWQRTAAYAQGPADELKTDAVVQAERWVAAVGENERVESEFHRAISKLEMALDENASFDDTERLWANVTKFEKPVSPQVQARYESRVSDKRLVSSRRHRIVLISVIAGMLGAAGIVWYLTQWGITARKTANWTSQIASAVEQDRLLDAELLLSQLAKEDQVIWRKPPIQSLAHHHDQKVAAEKVRVERFSAAMQQAEVAGIEHPDRDALKNAEHLAKSSQEKKQVENLTNRIRKIAFEQRRSANESYSNALEKIRSRFGALRTKAESDATDWQIIPQFQSLHTELRKLMVAADLTPPLRTAGEQVSISIKNQIVSIKEKQKRDAISNRALAHLTDLHGSPERLAEGLTEFAKQFPESPFASDFHRAATAGAVWEAVAMWSRHRQRSATIRITRQDQLDTTISLLHQIDAKSPDTPYSGAFAQYMEYLNRAEFALDPDNALDHPEGELYRLLTDPLYDNLYMITMKDGEQFYLRKDDELKPVGQNFISFKRFASPKSILENKPKGIVKDRNLFTSDLLPKLAPQSRYVDAARQWVDKHPNDWETAYLQLCALLMKQEGVNPIIRATLASQLVALSREYDWKSFPDLVRWHIKLVAHLDTTVNWVKPDREAELARLSAEKLLDAAPDFELLIGAIGRWERQFNARKSVSLVWRTDDGKFTVATPLPKLHVGVLETVIADQTRGWRFEIIGKIDQNGVSWNEQAKQQPAGTIIYWSEPPPAN